MGWKIKSKISDLNNARVRYLTTRNKPLSIAILLLLLSLLSIAKPLLVVTIIAAYGLAFALSLVQKRKRNIMRLENNE